MGIVFRAGNATRCLRKTAQEGAGADLDAKRNRTGEKNQTRPWSPLRAPRGRLERDTRDAEVYREVADPLMPWKSSVDRAQPCQG
jgi:hypothetical protein